MSIIYSFLQKRKMHESHHGFVMIFAAYIISALMLALGSDAFYNINSSAAAGVISETEEEAKNLQSDNLPNLQRTDFRTLKYGTELINPYNLDSTVAEDLGKVTTENITTESTATENIAAESTATDGDTVWLLGSAMSEETFDDLMVQMGSLPSVSNTNQKTANDTKGEEDVTANLSSQETVSTEYGNITDKEIKMLERITEAEASGEDMVGKILIVNVILNRVADDDFPDSIKEVIFQNKNGEYQFSPVSNDRYWSVNVSDDTEEAVERALQGEDYSEGALYFVARKRTSDNAAWFDEHLKWLFKHGGHEFYKNK